MFVVIHSEDAESKESKLTESPPRSLKVGTNPQSKIMVESEPGASVRLSFMFYWLDYKLPTQQYSIMIPLVKGSSILQRETR